MVRIAFWNVGIRNKITQGKKTVLRDEISSYK